MADASQSPGWYPDPEGAAGERWWNGAGWSDARRGGSSAASPAPIPTYAPPVVPSNQPPVIYSASNPAPQRPDPYGPSVIPTPPRAAMTINAQKNPMALYGLIAGIVGFVFNVFLVPSILAIVFSLKGLTRARQLQAAGEPNTLRSMAIAGLVLGILSGVGGVLQVLFFIVSIFSAIFVS